MQLASELLLTLAQIVYWFVQRSLFMRSYRKAT